MYTHDFPVGAGLTDVQRYANKQHWHLIKVKWIGKTSDVAHWRAYYIAEGQAL